MQQRDSERRFENRSGIDRAGNGRYGDTGPARRAAHDAVLTGIATTATIATVAGRASIVPQYRSYGGATARIEGAPTSCPTGIVLTATGPGWSLNLYFGRPYGSQIYGEPRLRYGYYAIDPGFAYGSLRIVDAPRYAQVFVDGYYAGEVDDYDGIFQRLNLEPGPHRIEIVIDETVPRRSSSTCRSSRARRLRITPGSSGRQAEGSKAPVSRFFRTLSQSKHWPFIAT